MKTTKTLTLFFFSASLTLLMIALALTLLNSSSTLRASGRIKTIGVSVWTYHMGAQQITEIDWGTLEPSETTTRFLFIRNDGNTPVTLTITTQNWTPANASVYIHFSTSYTGATIEPSTLHAVNFTLHIDAAIHDITTFSFDILIVASG